jgi:hypothetical protein
VSVPRILGVILMVGCPGDLAERVTTRLLPAQMVKLLIMLGFGELLVMRWLLNKGATVDPPDA